MGLGARPASSFVFDNEKWAHEVDLRAFSISGRVVTNSEFSEFVDSGGYTRQELWSAPGRAPREGLALNHLCCVDFGPAPFNRKTSIRMPETRDDIRP
jgi:formylglycine-generating enzyme required for sulfatase activity